MIKVSNEDNSLDYDCSDLITFSSIMNNFVWEEIYGAYLPSTLFVRASVAFAQCV